MNMTSKPDLGVWIGALSGALIMAAIIVGLFVVGGPGQARAQRLDDVRLDTMRDLAEAAQCAYTFTGGIPGGIEEMRADLRDRRTPAPACDNVSAPREVEGIAYQA